MFEERVVIAYQLAVAGEEEERGDFERVDGRQREQRGDDLCVTLKIMPCVVHLRRWTVVRGAEETERVDDSLETHPTLLLVCVALAHELRVTRESESHLRVCRFIKRAEITEQLLVTQILLTTPD